MRSIQESGYPLVFPVDRREVPIDRLEPAGRHATTRTCTRTLEGMQKEAVIEYGPTGRTWRMVCDEGPWLNGTDLAPFPLAFFTAGLAAQLMSEYLAEARDREISIDHLEIVQDNYFTMEGSALNGTMAAGVEPVEVRFSAAGDACAAELADIAEIAVADRAPTTEALQDTLLSRFAIRANDESLAWPGEAAARMAGLADPGPLFDCCQPIDDDQALPDIIVKSGESPPPGASPAVGLKADQRRTIHVRSEGRLRGDGLKEISVQCIQPAGSRFTLLSDESRDCGGEERAPNGLSYLSAGIAFCFMTQLGRYAQIVKQKLNGYRIVQDTSFGLCQRYDPTALPVETLVLLDTEESRDNSRQLVHMGEQTCYLHGAFRIPTETRVSFDER